MDFRALWPRLLLPFTLLLALQGLAYYLVFRGAGQEAPLGIVLIASAASALLPVAWMGLLLRHAWIEPTRRIEAAAFDLSRGDWRARVDLTHGADEIRDLADRINLLAAQAQKQFDQLTEQRADLQALVDALPDPILLADANGRVAVINTPAAKLLQVTPQQALGQHVAGVVSDELILQLFDTVDPVGGNNADDETRPATVTREIRLNRAGQRVTYQAVGAATQGGGVLLVLRNVTAMASTVQMKTDFVANASHELRTPIAAIRIAFDTLREVYRDDPEQTEKCMTIVDGHLGRLQEMLSDLLDLSRVEIVDLKPQLAALRGEDVFNPVRATLGPMAQKRLVELQLGDAEQNEIHFVGDRRLLNLIVKNLVENSIKFTPAGGRVTTTLSASDDPAPGQIILTVTDNGCGIPKEHLDRVFERFYQVDAARSGSAGRGTGLGLAIVKHAALGFGGKVDLQSTVGVGTTITVSFPKLDLPAQKTFEFDLPEDDFRR